MLLQKRIPRRSGRLHFIPRNLVDTLSCLPPSLLSDPAWLLWFGLGLSLHKNWSIANIFAGANILLAMCAINVKMCAIMSRSEAASVKINTSCISWWYQLGMKIEEAQEESAPGSLHILNSVSQNISPGIESTVSRVFGSLFPNDCILKLPLLQPIHVWWLWGFQHIFLQINCQFLSEPHKSMKAKSLLCSACGGMWWLSEYPDTC